MGNTYIENGEKPHWHTKNIENMTPITIENGERKSLQVEIRIPDYIKKLQTKSFNMAKLDLLQVCISTDKRHTIKVLVSINKKDWYTHNNLDLPAFTFGKNQNSIAINRNNSFQYVKIAIQVWKKSQ